MFEWTDRDSYVALLLMTPIWVAIAVRVTTAHLVGPITAIKLLIKIKNEKRK